MADPQTTPTPAENPDPTYEDRDINVSMIVVSIIAILIVSVASMVGLRLLFRAYEAKMYEPLAASSFFVAEEERPTEAVLLADEVAAYAAHRANEDAILNTAATVIDPDAGLAAIPIEDAIRIVAAKGLPSRESAE